MKKVYIVSDNYYLFGVYRTKKSAKATLNELRANNHKGAHIKRRVDTLGYLNIKD